MPSIKRENADKAKKAMEALPKGIYRLRIEEVNANPETALTKDGKYMPKVTFRVSASKAPEYVGKPLFPENFVLGTDEEPMGTEGPGLGRLAQLAAAAGVPCEGEVDQIFEDLVGQEVDAAIDRTVEPAKLRNGADNPYAGSIRTNIRRYYPVGERELSVADDDPQGPTVSSANGKPKLPSKAGTKLPAGFGKGK